MTEVPKRPLRVGVLVSATGANLQTVLAAARRRPDLIDVSLVATDRPGCPAAEVARGAGVPLIARDFAAACGYASAAGTPDEMKAYAVAAERFHDDLDEAIAAHETRKGPLDVLVLAYGRWIHGRLLRRFSGRMINQHPGDLTVLDTDGRRTLVGNNPVYDALALGHRRTRTSTFFVDEGRDSGPIICQGPWVHANDHAVTQEAADRLEAKQKRLSDPPSLLCALNLLARGLVHVDGRERGADGSALVRVAGRLMPLGGVDLSAVSASFVPTTTELIANA